MTSMIVQGQLVPNFTAQATSGQTLNLADFRGKTVVLYFYPKDDTPGCTTESNDFKNAYTKFKKLNAEIIGISRDSLKSHEKFKCKYELPFELISDETQALCNLFGVMKEKNMYGKKVFGIERSTFLIDKDGHLNYEWRGVKVPGHVDEVLTKIQSL